AIAAALEHLFRLHNQRRLQKQDRGIFESARLRAFHSAAAAKLGASGQVRVYLLRTPAAVLAALYGFQVEHRFLYFQSGFDPAMAEVSPGTVLLSAVIEDCIRRGLRRFEFLRGDERYKSRWTTERRLNFNALAACSWTGNAFLRLRARVRARRGPQLPRPRLCSPVPLLARPLRNPQPGLLAGPPGPPGPGSASMPDHHVR